MIMFRYIPVAVPDSVFKSRVNFLSVFADAVRVTQTVTLPTFSETFTGELPRDTLTAETKQ